MERERERESLWKAKGREPGERERGEKERERHRETMSDRSRNFTKDTQCGLEGAWTQSNFRGTDALQAVTSTTLPSAI